MANPVPAQVAAKERSDLGFFKKEEHTDVVFLVKHGSQAPQSFKAHKTVLAMRNEVFETMFYGSLPEDKQVRITDLHPDGFLAFLKYLYSQKAVFVDLLQALRTRTAAQKYMDSKLVENCDTFIRNSMRPSNVCVAISYVMEHGNLSNFDDAIGSILQQYGHQVLISEAFIAASKQTVIAILKNPRMRANEFDIIRCVYKWAHKRCGKQTYQLSHTTLRRMMKPFLPRLRFLTLTPQEFVEMQSAFNILTDSSAFAVLSNIIKSGSQKLPDGICTSKANRMPSS